MHSFMKRHLLMLAALLLFSVPCNADIYYYKDLKGGSLYLTNIPTNDPRYKLTRVMATPKYSAPKPPPSSYAPAGPSNLGANSILYGARYGNRQWTRSSVINQVNRNRYTQDITQIAAQYSLDPALMHAVISAESAYNPSAVSNKGAMGLMQLMPATARRFGVQDPFDPIANMHGGARYLRWLIDRFNNTYLAVAAYNAGEGAVERYGNSIPPYEETQTYVTRVLNYYNSYRRIN